MLKLALVPALALGALAIGGCGTEVTRLSSDTVVDLSGRWNDTDTSKIVKDIVKQATEAEWATKFSEKHNNRNPIIVIGKFIPRVPGEEINGSLITDKLVEAFVNSNKIDVLGDAEETRKILEDQATGAERPKEMGKEAAADFVLNGKIGAQNDQDGRKAVKFYVADFTVTDIQTRRIVWKASCEPIKKGVKQDTYKP